MSRQRTSVIEGILHRIEDRIEEWREQDRAHKAEAATQREKLWAAAAEREKLLAEAVAEEVMLRRRGCETTPRCLRHAFRGGIPGAESFCR